MLRTRIWTRTGQVMIAGALALAMITSAGLYAARSGLALEVGGLTLTVDLSKDSGLNVAFRPSRELARASPFSGV